VASEVVYTTSSGDADRPDHLTQVGRMISQAPYGRKRRHKMEHHTPSGRMVPVPEADDFEAVIGAIVREPVTVWDGDFESLPFTQGKATTSNSTPIRRRERETRTPTVPVSTPSPRPKEAKTGWKVIRFTPNP
jgi:hypothetical protein